MDGGIKLVHSESQADSPDALQNREGLDQPAVQLREEAGQKPDAGEHEQATHDPLDMGEMSAKAREEGRKRPHGERRCQERQTEP